MKRIAVFDIGGTKFRSAVFDVETGALASCETLSTTNYLTHPALSPEELLEGAASQIVCQTRKIAADEPLDGICVAFAGPVNSDGVIFAAPTILGQPLERPLELAMELGKALPRLNIGVLNDVTASGYEFVRRGMLDFSILTISSGIGNKVFINGRPLVGRTGWGGEIGHLVADWDSTIGCDCGAQGHFGALASGRGTVRYASEVATSFPDDDMAGTTITPDSLVQAFHQNRPLAVHAVDTSARRVGWALAATAAITGVEQFILMGGFAEALGERYIQMISKWSQAAALQPHIQWENAIILSENTDQLALLGAGYAVGQSLL